MIPLWIHGTVVDRNQFWWFDSTFYYSFPQPDNMKIEDEENRLKMNKKLDEI